MRLAARAAGCRPRSTSSSTARGRPLVVVLTPGQAGDSPMLEPLLAHLAVDRLGPGRPRTRPDALLGDKAYSSRAIRALLRAKTGQDRDPAARRPDRPPQTTRLSRRSTTRLRRRNLQGPQRDRAILQRPQAMARPGHPLRQARHRLPRRRRPPRHHDLATRIRRHALAPDFGSRTASWKGSRLERVPREDPPSERIYRHERSWQTLRCLAPKQLCKTRRHHATSDGQIDA